MKTTEIIEKIFSDTQIRVIKATINSGCWGDAETEVNGEDISGMGYCTDRTKDSIKDLTPKQIAGVFSGISKTLEANKIDFIIHIPDFWGEGKTSDGMLIVKYSVNKEIKEWAKS